MKPPAHKVPERKYGANSEGHEYLAFTLNPNNEGIDIRGLRSVNLACTRWLKARGLVGLWNNNSLFEK